MPPNLVLLPLFDVLLQRVPKIVIFYQIGVPPIFFKDLKGAVYNKRLKNTALVGSHEAFTQLTSD